MLIGLRIRILLFFILMGNLLQAQEKNPAYSYSLGADIFGGFIIEHHNELGYLIQGHPTGFRINLNRYTYGASDWERRYNYPHITAALGYYDLKNDEQLGKIVSLNFGIGFHINDHTRGKNDFKYLIGLGWGYISKPYNPDTNNKNTMISNRIPWNIELGLSYDRLVTERMKVGASLHLTHFSNAAIHVPNFGMNLPNLNVSAQYMLSENIPQYKRVTETEFDFSRKNYINMDFRIGFSEHEPVGTGLNPYYAIGVFWNRRVSAKSILDAGIEAFSNKAREAEIINKKALFSTFPDHRSVSVMIGHELMLERLALVTQLGVYLYAPSSPDPIYSKIGLKYYINNHLYGSLILKTHYAVAEVLEYGIGVRF